MKKFFVWLILFALIMNNGLPVFAATITKQQNEATKIKNEDFTVETKYEVKEPALITTVDAVTMQQDYNEYAEGQVNYTVEAEVVEAFQQRIETMVAFVPQTQQPYELAKNDDEGNFYFVEATNTLPEAISIAEASGEPMVVINQGGLITYSTQSNIARVFKTINGSLYTGCDKNTDLYSSAALSTASGYINQCYVDDVALLGIQGDAAKVLVSGKIAWIRISTDLVFVTPQQVTNPSYYANEDGQFVHYITTNLTGTSGSGSKITLGPANALLANGTKYYSYDGKYFYTNPETIGPDMADGVANQAVNATNPYYNYFLNLPFNSKSVATAAQIDAYINANTQATSKLRNTGQAFIDAQEKYGINAMLMLGIAINESAWGMSTIAQTKNNLFGLNAIDVTPGESANYFPSVEQCINDYASEWLAKGYADPQDWRYYGGMLGNKSMGANVKYASDPFWSEKAAAHLYTVDRGINVGSSKEWNYYSIGIFKTANSVKNTANQQIYPITAPDANGSLALYSSYTETPIILKETDSSDGKYLVWPARNNILNSSNNVPTALPYNWNGNESVASAGVEIINEGVQININVPIFNTLEKLVIKAGQSYNLMDGVYASDVEDGDLTSKVEVFSNININVIGSYNVTYSVTDNDGNTTQVERIVEVVANNRPVIYGVDNLRIKQYGWFDPYYGVYAFDVEDGYMHNLIVEGAVDTSVVGTYELQYSVVDSDGNKTIVTRVIEVETNEIPIIYGVKPVYLTQNETFDAMQGVTASDKEDGDLTDKIFISGEVNTNILGEYRLVYSVTDRDGNTVKVNRKVFVTTGEKPIISGVHKYYVSNGELYLYDGPGGNIEIPESVTKIGRAVFQGKRIRNVVFPEGVKIIGDEAFWGNEISTITFPKTLQIIGERAFYSNYSLEKITFLGSNKPIIGNEWLWSYYGPNTIQIQHPKTLSWSFVSDEALSAGSNVDFIRLVGFYAEISGTEDTAVKVGDTFDYLEGVEAFDEVSGDLSANIDVEGFVDPKTVGVYELKYSVENRDGNITTEKRTITVHNQEHVIADGVHQDGEHVFFTRNNGQLYKYAGPGGNIVIPQGVIAIEDEVFINTIIKDVKIPQGVTYIGVSSFQGSSLYNIDFPLSLIHIGDLAFAGNNLMYLKLPQNLQQIGERAFYSNYQLQKIIFSGEFPQVGIEWIWSYQQRTIAVEHPKTIAWQEITDQEISNYSNVIIERQAVFYPELMGINDITIVKGTNFDALAGITASDVEDGDLTAMIEVSGVIETNTAGKYQLIYSVTDSDGNTTSIQRTVTVTSNDKPVINGIDNFILSVGTEFKPLEGVTASDTEDGDVTSKIRVSGIVNRYQLGKYIITYTVVDSDGNTTSMQRIVTVDYTIPTDWTNNWASPYIRQAMEKGWITTSDKFRPEENITRAEFVKIVNKAFSFNEMAASEPFGDVKEQHWFYQEVLIAVKAGYISTSSNYFRPNETITREEVAAIITNIKGNKDTDFDKIQQYSDYNEISSWARDSVEGVVEAGYMGRGSDKFRPKNSISRAEAVVTLGRVFE